MSPDFERLIGRTMSDKAFRDQVLTNPEAAAKGMGLTLTAAELDPLKSGLTKMTSNELEEQFAPSAKRFWG